MSQRSPRPPRPPTSLKPAAADAVPPPPRNWVTVKEAAFRAEVDTTTIQRWCRGSRLVARRIGRSWRVQLAADGFPLFREEASP